MSAQKEIASILDNARTLINKRRESIDLIEQAAASLFYEIFGSPLTNHKEWETIPIAKIGLVTTGNTPSRSDAKNFGNGIEWIKSDNIDSSSMFLTPAAERLSRQGEAAARIVEPGSILVTCIAGTPNSIGNAAIADRRVAFNQQINAVTPFNMDPIFLYTQLRAGKSLVQEKSTGGMKGLVSKSRFESIQLMAPPGKLQHDFTRQVNALYDQKNVHLKQLHLLEYFFTAVRQRAFDGELHFLAASESAVADLLCEQATRALGQLFGMLQTKAFRKEL
jgi:type I restriction enzyme, S subunit